MSHDNAFLNYHRNAMIATVAGAAMVQYRKGESRPPLGAACLFVIGGLYMYLGSALYVWQALRLKHTLRLRSSTIVFCFAHAAAPCALWSIAIACLCDETPRWLLNRLERVERFLPSVLHKSLFVEAEALAPVVRMLGVVMEHERQRLTSGSIGKAFHKADVDGDGKITTREIHRVRTGERTVGVRTFTSGQSSPSSRAISGAGGGERRKKGKPLISFVGERKSDVLTDFDYVTIIWLRLQRLDAFHQKLQEVYVESGSSQVISAETVIPLLETLQASIEQLEIALDAEVERLSESSIFKELYRPSRWLRYLSPELNTIREEQAAVRALSRRVEAVMRDSELID